MQSFTPTRPMLPTTVVKAVGDLRPGEPLVLVHCAQCAQPGPGQAEEQHLSRGRSPHEAGAGQAGSPDGCGPAGTTPGCPAAPRPPAGGRSSAPPSHLANTQAGLATYNAADTPSKGWNGTWKSMTSMSSVEAGAGDGLGMGRTGVRGDILGILRPVSSSLASAWLTVNTRRNVTNMMLPPPHTVIMVYIYSLLSTIHYPLSTIYYLD